MEQTALPANNSASTCMVSDHQMMAWSQASNYYSFINPGEMKGWVDNYSIGLWNSRHIYHSLKWKQNRAHIRLSGFFLIWQKSYPAKLSIIVVSTGIDCFNNVFLTCQYRQRRIQSVIQHSILLQKIYSLFRWAQVAPTRYTDRYPCCNCD